MVLHRTDLFPTTSGTKHVESAGCSFAGRGFESHQLHKAKAMRFTSWLFLCQPPSSLERYGIKKQRLHRSRLWLCDTPPRNMARRRRAIIPRMLKLGILHRSRLWLCDTPPRNMARRRRAIIPRMLKLGILCSSRLWLFDTPPPGTWPDAGGP